MGKKSRDKGYRAERQIIRRHIEAGLPARRVPLSGACEGFEGDLIVGWGYPERDLKAEVKCRGGGQGWGMVSEWLEGNDLLFLVSDRKEPLVVMPFEVYWGLADAFFSMHNLRSRGDETASDNYSYTFSSR